MRARLSGWTNRPDVYEFHHCGCRGGSDLDAFRSARQTKDGGFIAAGGSWAPTGPDKTSPHYGKSDAWIVKLDAAGNKVWERSYGGTGLDGAGNTVETADGNYLVSISSDSPADGNKSLAGFGGFDSWILKLDPTKWPLTAVISSPPPRSRR